MEERSSQSVRHGWYLGSQSTSQSACDDAFSAFSAAGTWALTGFALLILGRKCTIFSYLNILYIFFSLCYVGFVIEFSINGTSSLIIFLSIRELAVHWLSRRKLFQVWSYFAALSSFWKHSIVIEIITESPASNENIDGVFWPNVITVGLSPILDEVMLVSSIRDSYWSVPSRSTLLIISLTIFNMYAVTWKIPGVFFVKLLNAILVRGTVLARLVQIYIRIPHLAKSL